MEFLLCLQIELIKTKGEHLEGKHTPGMEKEDDFKN